ncbi:MAG: hypothetical protein NVSMB62_12220 [Acidobacteriaceae bacterium]
MPLEDTSAGAVERHIDTDLVFDGQLLRAFPLHCQRPLRFSQGQALCKICGRDSLPLSCRGAGE